MLKLYGVVQPRAPRCQWMLNELGADYEHIPTNQATGDTQASEFLAVNPNGKIPVLDDDGFRIFESMAINLYLAMKYKGELWPDSLQAQAQVVQWSFWAMTEMEPLLITLLMERLFKPEDQRNEAAAIEARKSMDRPLKVLDDHLAAQPFLVGGSFTVADLNLASVMALLTYLNEDYRDYPKVQAWFETCVGRPAFQKIYAEAAE